MKMVVMFDSEAVFGLGGVDDGVEVDCSDWSRQWV